MSDRERPLVLARYGAIVFADKPAEMPTTPDRRGRVSLDAALARELGVARVHAASRLDIGVSGVVLCVLPSATQHVAREREAGRIHRVYVAIGAGSLEGEGVWSTPIGRAEAATRFRVIARARAASLLRCEPITGRMHQIRIHAAAAGAPLYGDREHGGPRRLTNETGRVTELDRIALHAIRCEIRAPDGEMLSVRCPMPKAIAELWLTLGGTQEALDCLESPE